VKFAKLRASNTYNPIVRYHYYVWRNSNDCGRFMFSKD